MAGKEKESHVKRWTKEKVEKFAWVCLLFGQTSVEEIERSLRTYKEKLWWRICEKRIHKNQQKEQILRERKGQGL